jgi:hypothetical protein
MFYRDGLVDTGTIHGPVKIWIDPDAVEDETEIVLPWNWPTPRMVPEENSGQATHNAL